MNPIETDVLVAGAGPTGLALATALHLRGHRTLVVERERAGANTSRAAVIHARTLEALETIGVSARLVERGIRAPRFTIRDRDRVLVPVRFDDLPTRYPYALMLSQAVTEAVLRERLAEVGGDVLWQRAVIAAAQDAEGVTARLSDGTQVRARYLVGADGMHSRVRDLLGIAFPGNAYEESFSLADVHLSGGVPTDEVILYFSPAGLVVVAPLPGGAHRIVATVDEAPEQPDRAYVQSLLDARGPEQAPATVREVLWGSRFRVHHRIAERYGEGRILLAGDAAHVHSPAGGQGMNTGLQDAMALAHALTRALEGDGAALAAYGPTRRPVAEQVVAMADRLTRLATVSRGVRPLRNALMRIVSSIPAVRRALAWRLSGLVYR
jgi:2-polyprenyl-6-methoxyphenol hydroxylase-like FAD-dependent oxidoreductase